MTKSIFKTLILTFALIFSGISYSSTDVSMNIPGKLTDAQKAEIQRYASSLAASSTDKQETPVVSPSEVKEWTSLISAIGDGFVDTAKKLGITANEFLVTPVGIMTASVLVWNYMGNQVAGMLFGIGWLIVMIPTWFWFFKRFFLISKITVTKKEGSIFSEKEIEYKNKIEDNEGSAFFFLLVLVAIIIVGLTAYF